MNKFAISVLITTAIAISVALDCSNIIYKESSGVLSYLATVNWTVPVSTDENGWTLTLNFDQNFTGVGVWEGFVFYNGTEKFAIITNRNSSDAELIAGQQKNLRFRVNFGLDIPVPQVISTRFLDIELCR